MLALAALAAVTLAAVWAFTRGPAAALVSQAVTHGSFYSTMQCDPKVPTREITDTFGGGGTIVQYHEGARCEMLFTLLNTSSADVTIEAIERTPPYFTSALRITDATRSQTSVRELNCYGCAEFQEPFTPFVMAPDEEWTIGIEGVMAGCAPPKGGLKNSGHTVYESIDVTIRAMGIRRVIPVALDNPYAVAVDECRG